MDEDPVPERIGDYVIERCLGVGGMAKVYLASHAVLDTRHAIKVLDPSYRANPAARQRFLDEAKIQASQLDHPNIVKVVNIVATTEHAALVMELIDGPSLESLVGELQANPAEIRSIMLPVLDALAHAHDKGIIHRDLKPANVLLAKRGNQVIPKVTDFGIAKIAGGGTAKKSTHADARMGTLTYSSPEQLRSPKDVTPRSDVFSLGAMLYELATGKMAFPGDNDYDVMDAIIKGRYTPPEEHHPAIDPVIAAVIRKALELAPANRFASCRDMADALSVAGTNAVVLPPVTKDTSPPRVAARSLAPSSGRGLWLGLGAVIVVIGGAVAIFAGLQGGNSAVADKVQDAAVAERVVVSTESSAMIPDAAMMIPVDAAVMIPADAAVMIPADAAARPGDELIGNYTCHVTCTNVGSQRCGEDGYACTIERDPKGTLRLRKRCCSFAWNLALSKITDESFVVTGDVCFGNGPCYGAGTLKRRGPNSFAGKILAKDEGDPVENVLNLVRSKK